MAIILSAIDKDFETTALGFYAIDIELSGLMFAIQMKFYYTEIAGT